MCTGSDDDDDDDDINNGQIRYFFEMHRKAVTKGG